MYQQNQVNEKIITSLTMFSEGNVYQFLFTCYGRYIVITAQNKRAVWDPDLLDFAFYGLEIGQKALNFLVCWLMANASKIREEAKKIA